MNYYAFHIGDYSSATMHLSWDEDLAYRRLIDVYYMKESALPAERAQIYRLVRAVSSAQKKAVNTVLDEFFTLTDEGYFNHRCAQELAVLADRSRKAKASAEARWRNANASDVAMRTHSEGNAPNTNTNTNNTVVRDAGARDPAEPLAALEAILRTAAGWQNETHPNLFVTGTIQALIDNGASLDLDVIPVVQSLAPKARARTSWNYFVDAIKRAQADRIDAISKPVSSQGGRRVSAKPSRADEALEAANAVRAKLGIPAKSAGHDEPDDADGRFG